ncbi:MAG TPA: histidinol dehydrogenase, partial [Acidimicrobiales bacterium]|nr:histidinol dehydrogenase [Acidimicrobiales bacterium]
MLQRLDLRGPGGRADDAHALRTTLPRPEAAKEPPLAAVQAILADVKARGDAAVRDATARFDHVELDDLRVSQADLEAALNDIPPLLREALEAARGNILAFHREQVGEDGRYEKDGLVVRELYRPVERAGCYVPGGRAVYPSTVLMTAIPARV